MDFERALRPEVLFIKLFKVEKSLLAATSEGLVIIHEKSGDNKVFDYERISIIPEEKHVIDFKE